MNWRFADLPIRTKFLITLGIPVAGLVLLIGKQVDSSLKRTDVLGYVSKQARNIRVIGDVMDGLQHESAVSVAILEGVLPNSSSLRLARVQSDAYIARMNDPELTIDPLVRPGDVLRPLESDRKRMDERNVSAVQVERSYRAMNEELLGKLAEVSKQAMDPTTNQQLFAHLGLLNTKEALSDIRTRVLRALVSGLSPAELGELNESIALYETSTVLFQRDAPPDVRAYYRSTFQGPEVNFLRSMIGTIHESRSINGVGTTASEWWELSGEATARLRQVEERSIDSIIVASEDVSRAAQKRLLLVLFLLLVVVGTVSVMAIVIMRGLRSTVSEVTDAASALAKGDVRARVPVTSDDEVGQMAGSFNVMIEAIRSLSASADAIGKGNYDTPVIVRGDQDVLGHSLTRMRDNLRSARERDMEHNRVLLQEKEKVEQANARIRTLIREIHHRVKNNLQVVSSMLRLQSGTIADEQLQQVFAQSQGRVASMALIHEKLYKGDDLAQVDLSQYIKELFAELVQLNKVRESIRYRTAIDPDLVLDLDTMVPLGLILNELITNSFKHAFTEGQEGFINLRIHRADHDQFDLHYSDNGGGIPKEKLNTDSGTLGHSLIESLVEQLNGFMTLESDATGTRYHIRFRVK
ncbi:MAG: nitrate- and nitrite sensing domain-containing protein [Flavobacteriales bacterium]|jgi:two-component sensor histidine kinase/HAMP domain-containing protein|nr:nitrate- and nitrite sensing domain-containing protein [Flavobacteriales bacterium]MCB0757802.1 nitrate- and nitrite sensing domain-containing protein [Flavobacteriales bacterium]